MKTKVMIFTFDKIFTDIMNIFIAFLSFWPFLSSVASRHKQTLCAWKINWKQLKKQIKTQISINYIFINYLIPVFILDHFLSFYSFVLAVSILRTFSHKLRLREQFQIYEFILKQPHTFV